MQPPPTSRRARLVVAALAATTFVLSLVLAAWLFPHLSTNNDEAVYVFQAKTLEHGSATLPAAPHADFFRPWMSGPQGDRQVLVFQPVFPATLALADLVLGTMRVVPGLIAAGCVVLMFAFVHETLHDERVALLAAAVMALSPLTLVHSAMYLEYLYAVLLELGVLLLVVRASRGHTTRRLVCAGLLHGLLFFMRPFDAILLGVVVVVGAVAPRPARLADAARTVGTVAVSAVPVVFACFLYNHHVTGHFLRFPLWAIGGDNSLGFGKKSIASGAPVIDFRFHDAWIAFRQNVRSFPHWVVGGVVSVPLGAFGAWRLRRHRVMPMLAAIAVLFPVGYLAYWGNVLIFFGRRTIGPHYYLALLIPACLVLAVGADALVRRGRAVGALVVALLLAGTVVELPDKIDRNHANTETSKAEDRAIHGAVAGADAVVVLPITADGPYVLHPRGWLMNRPDLTGPVLYAADRQGANVELFDRFPSRAIWRFQSVERPDGSTAPDMARLRALRVDGARAVPVTLRGVADAPVVVVHLAAGAHADSCVLDRASAPGRTYELRAELGSDAATLTCADRVLRVPLDDGDGTVSLGAAFGPNEDTGFSRVHEYRVWYRRDARGTSLVAPAEQWARDPAPTSRWRVTVDNPAIALSLG